MRIKVANKVPKADRPVKITVKDEAPVAVPNKEALLGLIAEAKSIADLKDILAAIVTGELPSEDTKNPTAKK